MATPEVFAASVVARYFCCSYTCCMFTSWVCVVAFLMCGFTIRGFCHSFLSGDGAIDGMLEGSISVTAVAD